MQWQAQSEHAKKPDIQCKTINTDYTRRHGANA